MKNASTYILTLFMAFVLIACESNGIEAKKGELNKLKEESKELKDKIAALEKEIAEMDTTHQDNAERNAALVSTLVLKKQRFDRAVEVRGTVESRTNISMSAEMGGTIKEILVREGQNVNQGDVLIRLDVSIMANQIKEAKTALDLAKTVYEKQAKLWEEKIGSEIQYLQAKNNYESLQTRLSTLNAQYEKNVIRAPFSGIVDELTAKVGQMAAPGVPLLRMVNPGDAYIHADVSESFVGKLEVGDSVKVYVPSLDTYYHSTISSIGQSIKAANRTFNVEVKFPKNTKSVKPNMLVLLDIVDYRNNSALVVPTRSVLEDLKGHYVFIAKKEGEHFQAEKKYVKMGFTSKNLSEITAGLSEGDIVIDKGSLLIAQGSMVKIQ